MNGCIYRTRSDLCMKFTTDQCISFCVGKKCPDRKESNADCIRSMTDKELANRIVCHVSCSCCPLEQEDCKKRCFELWLDWLKQEAADG